MEKWLKLKMIILKAKRKKVIFKTNNGKEWIKYGKRDQEIRLFCQGRGTEVSQRCTRHPHLRQRRGGGQHRVCVGDDRPEV